MLPKNLAMCTELLTEISHCTCILLLSCWLIVSIVLIICKTLWIKVSAKLLNLNVNYKKDKMHCPNKHRNVFCIKTWLHVCLRTQMGNSGKISYKHTKRHAAGNLYTCWGKPRGSHSLYCWTASNRKFENNHCRIRGLHSFTSKMHSKVFDWNMFHKFEC